jgi:phosphatidylserine decarboxylase
VINLFAAKQIRFMPNLSNGTVTRMGEPFAEALRAAAPATTDAQAPATEVPVATETPAGVATAEPQVPKDY